MEQIERVRAYLAAREAKPMPALADIIHGVNMGSEFEGELRLSDLRALAASHAELLEALRAIRDACVEQGINFGPLIADADAALKAAS